MLKAGQMKHFVDKTEKMWSHCRLSRGPKAQRLNTWTGSSYCSWPCLGIQWETKTADQANFSPHISSEMKKVFNPPFTLTHSTGGPTPWQWLKREGSTQFTFKKLPGTPCHPSALAALSLSLCWKPLALLPWQHRLLCWAGSSILYQRAPSVPSPRLIRAEMFRLLLCAWLCSCGEIHVAAETKVDAEVFDTHRGWTTAPLYSSTARLISYYSSLASGPIIIINFRYSIIPQHGRRILPDLLLSHS